MGILPTRYSCSPTAHKMDTSTGGPSQQPGQTPAALVLARSGGMPRVGALRLAASSAPTRPVPQLAIAARQEEEQSRLAIGPGPVHAHARRADRVVPGESECGMARFTPRTNRERDALCMVGHKRERVLGRVGRAVNAAARDSAREAAQLLSAPVRRTAGERGRRSIAELGERLQRLRFYAPSSQPRATWSTWSAVSNRTSRAGELRSAPSGPDDWDRVTG